jgi:hypothetical protein
MVEYSRTDRQVLTSEQRKAKDAERRADAEQAMREHRAAQKAFHENRERLRALRLAREANALGKTDRTIAGPLAPPRS